MISGHIEVDLRLGADPGLISVAETRLTGRGSISRWHGASWVGSEHRGEHQREADGDDEEDRHDEAGGPKKH